MTTVSKEADTENIEDVETEKTREPGIENSKEMQKDVKEKNISNTISRGSRAPKLDMGTEVDAVRYAMKRYGFIPDTSF